VDISALFGVATTIVQGDLEALERAVLTGIIEPWTAINFGDSQLAPRRTYLMPDADAEQERTNLAQRMLAFHEEVSRRKANGFVVDQDVVNKLAEAFGVPAPALPAAAPAPAAEETPQAQPKPAVRAVS
jgi:hypothetical protein